MQGHPLYAPGAPRNYGAPFSPFHSTPVASAHATLQSREQRTRSALGNHNGSICPSAQGTLEFQRDATLPMGSRSSQLVFLHPVG